ncbi:MAG: hypothetical protein ABI899_07940 [Actinomycetota bacterium]
MIISKREYEFAERNSDQEGTRHLRVMHGRQGVDLRAAERAVRGVIPCPDTLRLSRKRHSI